MLFENIRFFHFYADDLQLWFLSIISVSIERFWRYIFQLNRKTELFIFSPTKSSSSFAGKLGHLTPRFKSHAKDLGIILEPELCFDKQMHPVVNISYYNLRIISELQIFKSHPCVY